MAFNEINSCYFR